MSWKPTKRKLQYNANKAAKVGDEIVCPICGTTFKKVQWQQAFCCGKCKDDYWNAKGDRHKDPNYHSKYNQKHPERYAGLLGLGLTAAEREENEALYEYATNPDFRAYVNDPPIGEEAESFGCEVSLATQLENYRGE